MPADTGKIDSEFLDRLLFEDLCLNKAGHFFVAYSGGLDSTVLLHAMAGLRRRHPLVLTALHLDHGLQEESSTWREHCAVVCDEWDIPLVSERIDVVPDRAMGLEASARRVRYQWLQSAMGAAPGYLLTAHHQQDQAETFLLNLLRGSGVDGLSASMMVTPLGSHKLVRPMLGIAPEAINTYAHHQGLEWVMDPSNRDERFRRNRIRASLIPVLQDIRADVLPQVSIAIENLQDTRALLDEIGAEDIGNLAQSTFNPLDKSRGLSMAGTADWSERRFANLLRYWLRTMGYPVPGRRLLAQLEQWRTGKAPGSAILRKGGFEFRAYRGMLYVMPVLDETPCIEERAWPDLRVPLSLPMIGVSLHCDSRWIEETIGGAGFVIKGRQGGEMIAAPGNRFSRKLRKFYQGKCIPPWLRYRYPLVYLDGELVTIPGIGQFGSLEGVGQREPLIRIEAEGEDHPRAGLINILQ
jgi:tRNA(Ile)-lysidine synthase